MMKRIFIIVAIVIVAIIVAIGVTLYLNNIQTSESPQVALPVPISPPPPPVTPEVVKTPKPVETPPPADPAPEPVEELPKPEPELKLEPVVIPDDFIVDNKHWKNASILRKYDGTKYQRGGVVFVEIPTGTKLYTPVAGYVRVFSVGWNGQQATKLIISSHKEGEMTPDNSYFFFMANRVSLSSSALGGKKIEQGQEFASIKKSEELFPGFFDRKGVTLAVGFLGKWETDEMIEDPREFLWVPIQQKIIGEDK